VSYAVDGGAALSNANLGVKGSAGASRSFMLWNHRSFADTTPLGQAIIGAFESFVFPFAPESVSALGDGDFVDYEFAGRLALGFGVSYGFGGVLIGGRSGGEVTRSFASPLGSIVAKAKPSFRVGVGLDFDYTHEDDFRVVVGMRRPAGEPRRLSLALLRARVSDAARTRRSTSRRRSPRWSSRRPTASSRASPTRTPGRPRRRPSPRRWRRPRTSPASSRRSRRSTRRSPRC
jgi:hypothetical protein